MPRIIIFITLDGVRPPHRDGQSSSATAAATIRQLSTARRPRVRDYDKSMIAVGEFITRLARMRFRSRGRSRKASSSTGCEHRGSFTKEGGRVGLSANPARCMVIKISGKNIANGRHLFMGHICGTATYFSSTRVRAPWRNDRVTLLHRVDMAALIVVRIDEGASIAGRLLHRMVNSYTRISKYILR